MKTLIVYYSHEGNTDFVVKKIAAFACQSGKGAENAFEKLKDSIGIATLTSTLILIDPKDKPSNDNDRKIEEFCKEL